MINELSKWGVVQEDACFKNLTTIKVGGKIKYYFEPNNIYALTKAINIIKDHNYPFKIIGNGSNILCSDKYYDGVVIKLNNLNHFELNENEMYIEAGVPIITAANFAINNGYSGLEWATGIPALIGGIVYMNASAYNEGISDVISEVLVFKDNRLEWFNINDLNFGYRTSSFQSNKDWIIVAVNLILKEASIDSLKEISINRNKRRFETQPFNYPNCGSIFRNLDDMPVWKVIDSLDLRGKNLGNAQISEKHSNFITNMGNAKADDVNSLIEEIVNKAKVKFNIDLHLEVERFNW